MSSLSTAVTAGLLLAALPLLSDLGFEHPSATAVLEALGVPRTTGYALRSEILQAAAEIQRAPGRPKKAPAPLTTDTLEALHTQVLEYVFDHPGCVTGTRLRRTYSDGFRFFALELCAAHQELPLDRLAQALDVPERTLRDWLAGERPQAAPPKTLAGREVTAGTVQVEAVLDAYTSWEGSFRSFCDHVQAQLRIPFSRALIGEILQEAGGPHPPATVPSRTGRRGDARWI